MSITGLKLKAAERRQRKYDEGMAQPEGSWDRREAESQFRSDAWEAYAHQAHLERKAIAAQRKAEREAKGIHTCQVCGRDIQANTGVIAHHGYQRPAHWHAQTASCLGARYEPYEQSCERLKQVVVMVQNALGREIADRAKLDVPPATITYQHKVSGWGSQAKYETRTLAKPEDFQESPYHIDGYGKVLNSRRQNLDYTIKAIKSDLATMQERVASWVKK
jgi:hypothetical protein